MKKAIMMLAAAVLFAISAVAVTPADLAGTKWKSKKLVMPSQEEALKVSTVIEYVFQADGQVSEQQDVTMSLYDRESKVKIDMYMRMNSSGTYTADGDSITIKTDPATVKVVCEDDDIRVTFPGGESNAIMESMIKSQMRPMVDAMEAEIRKDTKEEGTVLKNVEINGKKATAENDGTKAEFSIKKI